MKKFYLLFTLAFVVLFVSCSQNRKLVYENSLERQWMLKTLPGVTYEELLAARAEINLTNLKTTGAYGGCNRIFFTTKTGGNHSISFTGIGSTKMYCEKFMKTENSLVSTLQLVDRYELNGHQITFKDAAGKVLMTAVAADWD